MLDRTKTKKPKSLVIFLTVAFSILGTVILLVTSGLEIYFNFRTQQTVVIKQQAIIAEKAADEVKGFIDGKVSLLSATVRFGDLISPNLDNQKLVLDSLLGYEQSFRQIVMLDRQGEELIDVSRTSLTALNNQAKAQIGDNFFTQMKQGKSYVSSIYVNESTNEPMIILAVPIKDLFGDFQGALLAETNLKFMWDLVSGLKVGNKGTAYVVDRQGNLLAHPDISKVLKGEKLTKIFEVSEFINGKDSIEGDAEISKGISGNYVMSNYISLVVPDWAIVVEFPIMEAYNPVIKVFQYSLWLTLLVIFLTVGAGTYIAKKIVKPIIGLRDAALEISKGNLNTQIKIKSSNEIGQLANSFNHMASELKQSYQGLEQKVGEQTHELNAKVEELGRTNKLMIGRELKMIELKEEIKNLKEKTNKT
jgi:methyl-accepting chemotaxis protein